MTQRHRPVRHFADMIDSSNISQRFEFRSLNEQEAVYHALRIASQVSPFHAAEYWTVQTLNDGKTAARAYEYGEYPADCAPPQSGGQTQSPDAHSIIDVILREEKPVYIDDYQNHPLADHAFMGSKLHEACYIPIHVRQANSKKLVGVLVAVNYDCRVGKISANAVSLLEAAVYQLQMSLEYLEAMIKLDASLTLQRKLYDSIHRISTSQTPSDALLALLQCFQTHFDVSAAYVALVSPGGVYNILGSFGFHSSIQVCQLPAMTFARWTDAVTDDPKSLVMQLELHSVLEPSSFGLCVDEMDWAIVCPLFVAGETFGYVSCYGTGPLVQQMDETIDQLCTVYAGVYSSLVETERAIMTKVESLSALGIALESRDGETFGHTERVVSLMKRFVQLLDVSTTEAEQAEIGAYLHDIGKISTPDSVLLKRGPLTPDERRLIETHTLKGLNIARRLPFASQTALDIILSHHERWDGTGYPHGLGGEQIPLLARVFAIIDVYDALTHERPYKEAWTHEQACAYLSEQAGFQFDPDLIHQFLQLIDPHDMDIPCNRLVLVSHPYE